LANGTRKITYEAALKSRATERKSPRTGKSHLVLAALVEVLLASDALLQQQRAQRQLVLVEGLITSKQQKASIDSQNE
jgi:hypothetical protein